MNALLNHTQNSNHKGGCTKPAQTSWFYSFLGWRYPLSLRLFLEFRLILLKYFKCHFVLDGPVLHHACSQSYLFMCKNKVSFQWDADCDTAGYCKSWNIKEQYTFWYSLQTFFIFMDVHEYFEDICYVYFATLYYTIGVWCLYVCSTTILWFMDIRAPNVTGRSGNFVIFVCQLSPQPLLTYPKPGKNYNALTIILWYQIVGLRVRAVTPLARR